MYIGCVFGQIDHFGVDWSSSIRSEAIAVVGERVSNKLGFDCFENFWRSTYHFADFTLLMLVDLFFLFAAVVAHPFHAPKHLSIPDVPLVFICNCSALSFYLRLVSFVNLRVVN